MGFIYDIHHAAAAKNIAVYIIVIYWTSCSAGCWTKVAFQMYGLGSGVGVRHSETAPLQGALIP